jgi:hypothetical protein
VRKVTPSNVSRDIGAAADSYEGEQRWSGIVLADAGDNTRRVTATGTSDPGDCAAPFFTADEYVHGVWVKAGTTYHFYRNGELVCRGAWARVTLDQFRRLTLRVCREYSEAPYVHNQFTVPSV